jgi:hypothetical protein
VFIPSALNLLIVLVGQGPAEDTPAGRLELMKTSLAGYEVRRPGEQGTAYRLQADPVLRFTNSVGTVEDGAIFLWLDPEDRPAAAVQVFRHRVHGIWYQEFTSLSTAPLSAGSVWEVPGPGVGF